MRQINFLLLLFIFGIHLISCDKKDPEIPNEEELITTLKYILTPVNGGASVEFVFQDLDGDGGDVPSISEGILANNTVYKGVVELLNETKSPAEDIANEVEDEGVDHQLFYDVLIFDISYEDLDENNNPIGINTELTTGTPDTTSLTITLRHKPSKSAANVSNGDITNAGGETDIEVTFNVVVE